MHQLPSLNFSYSALEPHIDAQTMELHHQKHHQAYIDKLNAALEKHPQLFNQSIEALLTHPDSIPEDIRQPVINHGGGHANHTFFWSILSPQTNPPTGKFLNAINASFASFDQFQTQFIESALSQFGSGWAWLVLNQDQLAITTTSNQNSPLSQGQIPLLAVDVWEHAYYLKYQNRRSDYLQTIFKVINWPQVEALYSKATA